MCDFHDHHDLEPLEADEWVLDTPTVRAFIADVRHADRRTPPRPADACASIEPGFRTLLADRTWLPDAYAESAPESGMGGGIGQWLLYRSADRSLCLFSLVVPAGSMTPIHDHLAWGLIGLYRGGQDEEIYRPGDGTLETVVQRPVGRRRLLPAAAARQRRPPRADNLGGHVGLDPPARERHRLHPAPHLRRADGRGARVPLRLRQRGVRGRPDRGRRRPRRDSPT